MPQGTSRRRRPEGKDRALRHIRRAPCRSSSSPPHACSRTREALSDRCPYARCSDCAEASWACSDARSSAAVPASSGAISANLPHAYADPVRSADGAPTASNLPSKDRVSGSTAPLPARFDTRPQHGLTRTGCRPLPTNDEAQAQDVVAEAPLAELFNYVSALRSLSQGRASFKMALSRHAPLPTTLMEKVLRPA